MPVLMAALLGPFPRPQRRSESPAPGPAQAPGKAAGVIGPSAGEKDRGKKL